MATTATTISPADFLAEARSLGFSVSTKPGMVIITKVFARGDAAAFVICDGDGPGLLMQVPTTSAGSMWGTDGGGVGGIAAIQNGVYKLKVSGASKRFTNALGKLLGA